MKKFISLFAALFLYCNALVAQSGSIGTTGLRWDFDGSTRTLTISSTAGIVNMPDFNDSSIRPDWEAVITVSDIESVIIEDGVASIGNCTFYDHGNLNSIEISSSVTSIRRWAFYGCTSLTNINIPNSVKSIEDGIFQDCTSLTHINIPNSI